MPLWHTTGLNRELLDSYSVVIPKLCTAPSLVVAFKQPRCAGETRCLGQSNIAGWYCVASWTLVTLLQNTMLSCLDLPVCTERSLTALLSSEPCMEKKCEGIRLEPFCIGTRCFCLLFQIFSPLNYLRWNLTFIKVPISLCLKRVGRNSCCIFGIQMTQGSMKIASWHGQKGGTYFASLFR